jgi:hypothetical protein
LGSHRLEFRDREQGYRRNCQVQLGQGPEQELELELGRELLGEEELGQQVVAALFHPG